MTDTKYNGWTNYETWVVNLWLDNSQESQAYINEIAQSYYSSAESDKTFTRLENAALAMKYELQEIHEANAPEVTGVYADMLNASLRSVNWYEIAKNWLSGMELEKAA
jgi:hypothetical protein